MGIIHVKNVLFGDCNIIENGNKVLVVDCGTLSQGFRSSGTRTLPAKIFAYSKIRFLENRSYLNNNLLLSHYHTDHFNGILHLAEQKKIKFNHIYLPYTVLQSEDYENKVLSNDRVSNLASLFCVALPNSNSNKITDELVVLWRELQNLVNDFHNIRCLKQGDEFVFGHLMNEVLWPKVVLQLNAKDFDSNAFQDDNKTAKKKKEISQFLKNTGRQKEYDNIYKLLYELLRLLNDEARSLKDYNAILKELEKKVRETKARTANTFNNAKDAQKQIEMRVISMAAYHCYINDENERAIVFHEKTNKGTAGYVFLSDVSDWVIREIWNEPQFVFKNQYTVVKVQHHGTDPHYSQRMPNGSYYIISNGARKKWPVSERLVADICRRNPNNHIYCTGAHAKRYGGTTDYCQCKTCCPVKRTNVKFNDNDITL